MKKDKYTTYWWGRVDGHASKWMGIDRAAGHGKLRGEVIKRESNIVYVRFRDVGA